MKTLKTITIATFLLFAITNVQAQTKEETIAWIKEKLEMHAGLFDNQTATNVQVSPCKIYYTINVKLENSDDWYEDYYINLALIKSWTVCETKRSIIADSDYTKSIQTITKDGKKNNYPDISIRNDEPNIHERMIKALLHLATFCGKNEAF